MVRSALLVCLALVVGVELIHAQVIGAQDMARLQSGVVKITAKPPEGFPNVGTGFIVRLETNAAYIVTAAHVVAGDAHPKVEFFTKRNIPVMAEVLGLEGDDEVRGIALVVVRGTENLPKGITSLPLATASLSGGEDILVIGFPRNAGPWALIKGNISSREGRDIHFSPSVDSGHSGGPVLRGGNVVAMVGSGRQSAGRGVTARSVQDYIEGFGIMSQDRTSAASMATESSPPPAATAKPESRHMTQDREITGKDGAPMVLVPAGEFWMGSDNEHSSDDWHPRHQVSLDAFYMDKFEVTVARYAEFVGSTNRSEPKYWDQVDSRKHGTLPVVGVDWHDAEAYCQWAGRRLPTEAEWEKAARGTDERIFPWGHEQPTERLANSGKRRLWAKIYEDYLAPVDSYDAGKSPYGLHHMAGNVWEWTADLYDENYYSKSPARNPKGPSSGEDRVFRGGSLGSAPFNVRSYFRTRHSPTTRIFDIGFRCAQDNPK